MATPAPDLLSSPALIEGALLDLLRGDAVMAPGGSAAVNEGLARLVPALAARREDPAAERGGARPRRRLRRSRAFAPRGPVREGDPRRARRPAARWGPRGRARRALARARREALRRGRSAVARSAARDGGPRAPLAVPR